MSPVATPEAPAPAPAPALAELRPRRAAAFCAFRALLLRDLAVLRKELPIFVVRTIMQPLLLLFVFTYVFPRIGQAIGGPGGGAAAFSTMLVSGVVATAMIFQGIQAVALPLVREFGYTREIEDRVLAPLPVWAVAVEKIVSGALQALIAGAIVFPLAAVVPVSAVHLQVAWPALLAVAPLAALTGACLGLALGTRVQPHQVPLMFSVIVIPITFLGGTYYGWTALAPVKAGGFSWLQTLVLFNPLIYVTEGLRAALTTEHHMHLYVIYPVLLGFAALFFWQGIRGFRRRVLS
ncbi:MAG TPA: ABC transporter permease [Acidimicrobiia bacterium]|nr:ABC transporter permease [Acidimicrobiia bacterium]